ncbi:putative major pilin subunit [Pseudomonas sp. SCT]|jgi:type IV fimbrial biogenesis protein FimT|uniref:GspH/FimT family pseudopilin n=1 Tax=Pseudomonas sp. (strain SCT) TaxID=412955 RepID=UPI000ECE8F35|nr:putative major pilin subunit [Pseudomonas sp. SCT]
MRRLQQAFTLIELMITIGILSIVLAIAVPALSQSVNNVRLTSLINDLTTSATYARSEAVKRSRQVVICRANNARNGCDLSGGSWSSGWLIFVDSAATDTATPVYAASNLLRISDVPPVGSEIAGRSGATGRGWVRYSNVGTMARAATNSQVFSWDVSLSSAAPERARTVQIGLAGRPSICKGAACE